MRAGQPALRLHTERAECDALLRRDTRWHGGSDSNQQDKAEVEPDWSPEAERRRWDELQEAFQARRERGFGAGGVNMFMALVEDGGCKCSSSLCVFIRSLKE